MRCLWLFPLLFLACAPVKKSRTPDDGYLAIQYRGPVSGSFAAKATATWCPGDSLLEIVAISHDTGVALSVLPATEIQPETHPLLPPEDLVDRRPRGLAALRWISGDTSILAFKGSDGTITITAANDGYVSGRLTGTFASLEQPDTLQVDGTFSRLSVGTAEGPCGRLVKRKAE